MLSACLAEPSLMHTGIVLPTNEAELSCSVLLCVFVLRCSAGNEKEGDYFS